MADEHDESGQQENAEEESHPLKKELREGVAKAFGFAVEAGSILAGQAGEVVGAERAVAEEDAEDLIDRIDGEG